MLALTPPLALLFLTDLLAQRRWPALVSGAALGVVAAAQVLTWGELLATTALMSAVAVVLALMLSLMGYVAGGRADWERRRPAGILSRVGGLLTEDAVAAIGRRAADAPSCRLQRRSLDRAPAPRWRRPPLAPHAGLVLHGTAGGLATFLLIAGAPLLVGFRGPQRIQGVLHRGDPLAADLLNFIVPTSAQLVTPASAARLSGRFAANAPEANAYLGLPLLALLVFIVARWWGRPLVRWAGLLATIAAVLSLGGHLRWGGTRRPYRCRGCWSRGSR